MISCPEDNISRKNYGSVTPTSKTRDASASKNVAPKAKLLVFQECLIFHLLMRIRSQSCKKAGGKGSSFLRRDLRFVWFLQIEGDSFPNSARQWQKCCYCCYCQQAPKFSQKCCYGYANKPQSFPNNPGPSSGTNKLASLEDTLVSKLCRPNDRG